MEGSYYPSLLGTSEAVPGIVCTVLGPPQCKKKMEESGEGPAETCGGSQWHGAYGLQGEVGRAGRV